MDTDAIAAAVEDQVLQVRGLLFMSSLDSLKKVIRKAGLNDAGLNTDNRVEMVKFLDDWLLEELDDGDKAETAMETIRSIMEHKPTESGGVKVKKEPQTPSDVKPEVRPEVKQEVKPEVKQEVSQVRFHREFKISGLVDLKSGISFTSLVRQIENGQKKGYSEIEIIDAVIKAIPTTSGLRNYLEGRTDLCLASLRGILRAHYLEKSATERYNELGAATQGPNEEASEFLMRTLDIRNKILFSSQEKASDLRYDPELVNGLFRRTVYTGLRDISIRQEFRHHLEDKNILDEDLIQNLNRIVSKENERKTKLGRSVKALELGVAEDSSDQMNSKRTKADKNPKEGLLVSEVRALKAEVAELKEIMDRTEIDRSRSSREDAHGRTFFKPGCPACRESDDMAKKCDHCWRCGSAEHYKKGCRVRTKDSGNGPRSQRGGRQ